MELKSIIFIVIVLILIYLLFSYVFLDVNTLHQNVINNMNESLKCNNNSCTVKYFHILHGSTWNA